jgi:hypothetical protein
MNKFQRLHVNIVANGYTVSAFEKQENEDFLRPAGEIFVFTSPSSLAAWVEKSIVVPAACCAEAGQSGCCGSGKKGSPDWPPPLDSELAKRNIEAYEKWQKGCEERAVAKAAVAGSLVGAFPTPGV